MLNNVVLVGRVVEAPVLRRFEGDYSGTFITLAVARPFKSYENKQEVDFIRVIVWEGLAENASLYCHKGDIIGVEGRIETSSYDDNGEMKKATVVIAKKISFLSKKDELIYENRVACLWYAKLKR